LYYIHDNVVTQDDIDIVKYGWNLILKCQTLPYLNIIKNKKDLQFNSCISWFSMVFYDRLFNVHPSCQPLFTAGLVGQGKFLVRMITVTLSQLGNPEVFKRTMISLAISHCKRGVKACEYGIVGEVLFYALNIVQGEEIFTVDAELSWKRVYSAMLRIIVPLVIAYETGKDIVMDDNYYQTMSNTGTRPITHQTFTDL
jgi:hemoglobin-like flavoprotein